MRRILGCGLALYLLIGPRSAVGGVVQDGLLSLPRVAERELLDELRSAPRDNAARVQRLRELYEQAGAQPDQIRLQPVDGQGDAPPLHNVIVTKKGTTDSVIVVGGHLDRAEPGDGIIDDWSGACLATNLFQTIRDVPTTHTFVFIGFAHEELGLLGSRAYVASLSDAERKKVRVMVNLECLGVDDPFIWTNGSTDSLEVLARQVAGQHQLPLRDHQIIGVGADSIPFDRAGIPNITFDGMAVEHFRFIHSPLDKFENVKPEAYLNAYRVASQFLATLDRRLAETPALLQTLDPGTAKKVDAYVAREMTKRHIPGLSLAVVQNGELVLAKGYGMANVELAVPATADTLYQIGSITKPFTATAIMMLVLEGKLALDDPISKHLPNTPDAWKAVTVRHLLNHTSGIKSYTSIADNMQKSRLDRSRDEIIGTVRDLPLEFPPGERWAYNNTGYFLLGLILERVSGKPYAEWLQGRVFGPSGMAATRVNDLAAIVKDRSAGYAWRSGRLWNAEHASMTWPFSAGAIVSSVHDLAKWDAVLYSEKVLPRASLMAMWTPTKLSGGRTHDYGFGWSVGEHRGHRMIGHGGGISGFSTDLLRLIDDKLTVIVLTNLEGANPSSIARGVAALYLPDLAPVASMPIEGADPLATALFKPLLDTTLDVKPNRDPLTAEMPKGSFPIAQSSTRDEPGGGDAARIFAPSGCTPRAR
jgi:CubicO group peptidase (beta-lactamase class C family)